MRQFYIILSFILSLPLFASAQLHYPIRTTTIVTPPVPYTLDGFVSQPGRLMLHIMVDDITLSQYPVKLRLHIEGNGIRITTNPNTPQQPVYLDGGVVTQLTGPDLELFFNPSNLLFQGYSQGEYNRNGRLPEGVYRIRFEVLDYYRDFQVSSAIPAVAMLSLTGAPVLTFPANRSEVDIDMTPVLRFSWMAVFSAIPDALISYRFRLWQVRPDSRDPYEIVRVTSPLYETTTHETALLYDGSMPPLTRGSRYVWQVTAIDEGGKVLFKNNGDSDIFTLRYGKQCSAPSAVITKVTHNSVAVSWNSDPSVREYAVRYKKEDATGWQEVTTRQAGITIEGLDHSALYELTVTGICGGETSANERVLRFKTDRFVDYSCGASAPGINLENREPLPALHRFDEFMAAGFYIEVTEVSGSNGVFSGRGIASVPYLNFLQFEVVFNGITINSDRRMIDGKVVFVYDEATGMIIGGDMGRGDDPSESGPEAYNHQEALEYIAGQVITLDEDVQTVTIDNKGQVTVVTESGQKKSYLVGENQTLAIITPQSTTIVDQASGQTFHLPNTSPGSSSDVRSRAQSKLYGCEVSFRPSANSRFGFDVVGNGSVKPNSYFKRDRGGNAVPWKSLETGNSDLVTMLSTGDCPPDSLRLIRESGILTPTKPGSNNTLELLLTGGFEGQEELLTVARATLLHINDTTGSEILTEAGALGVVSYRRSTQNVVLVPVNSAGFPTQGTDRSVIIRRLNEIYGAAVVSWNVHIDNPIEVGRINEEDFKVEGTALLSKYTSDMNRVIRAYKRDRVTDDNTMYLFFMEIPNLGSNRKGFMPLAGNYGFIFNFEARDLELIAHELAHGAFNLRHTFSDKAQHYFPQNQTANLMDYAGGTELWKYQWDLIHNPESILFSWAQDEEEGASVLSDVFSIIELIRDAKLNNKECVIPIYSHTVVDNIYDIASDKTIKEDIARRYSGMKFQIFFDENSIEKKVLKFDFDHVDIKPVSNYDIVTGTKTEISLVDIETKVALISFRSNSADVSKVQEFLFGDVEKDCAPIIEGITNNLNENKEVDLSELSASCAAQIPLETRKKLVNYILNKWWVSEKYEHALLVLIEQVQDENVDDFISYLRNDKLDDKFVYQQLMSAIDDINGKDYYAALMQVFTRLLLRQSEYASGEPELKEIILVGKKPWINISEIPEFEYRYEKKPSYNSTGDIEVTYKIRLMTAAQLKKTPAYTTSPTGAPVKQAQVTYLDKTFVWKSDNLSYTYDPLSLVFVAKQSETANVEDILQEETAEGVIVPAALLMYNSDKVMQQNIEQGVYITLDAATILLSGGTLLYVQAAGKAISTTRKALLLLELANGLVNLTVNISELAVNPKVQEFLFVYNLSTAGFNLACSAKNIKWLRKSGQVLDGCENISETLVRRMSKYDETKRVGFFNDFGRDKSLLNQVDNLSDAEFDELMKRYNIDLDVDARKKGITDYFGKSGDELLAIGENISRLTSPPKGYSFYTRADGKKWIRRINAADPNTPRLTVKDGKIVRFAGATDASQTVEFVYHVKSDKIVQNVIDDIEPAFFGTHTRFGPGFYVASDGETAIAEVMHHGGSAGASKVIRFTMSKTQLKVLDLTDESIASAWKLNDARAYELAHLSESEMVYYKKFQEITQNAANQGYNAIRYKSYRNPGGVNYVIIGDDKEFFKQVFKPQMVMPGVD